MKHQFQSLTPQLIIRLFSGSAVLGFALLGAPAPSSAQTLGLGSGGLRVMTYNVDEGTDYLELEQATTLPEFLVAVGQTITQVRAPCFAVFRLRRRGSKRFLRERLRPSANDAGADRKRMLVANAFHERSGPDGTFT